MKLLRLALALAFFAPAVSSAADEFWPAAKNYLQKYGIPCVAGVAAGYVIDRDKGVQIGAVGCIVVFSYGEFGRGSNRTITNDDLEVIQDLINKSNRQTSQSLGAEVEAKFQVISERLNQEAQNSRATIRNAVTDLGVFLEKDISTKMEQKIQNPALLETVDKKISEKVKDEVQGEFKSKEREIILKTTDMVIKRVVAEPVIVDEKKKEEGK